MLGLSGRFSPRIDTREVGTLRVKLTGPEGSYTMEVPSGSLRANSRGTTGIYSNERFAFTVSAATTGLTFFALRATDPGLLEVLGGDIAVKITMQGYAVGSRLDCSSKVSSGREVVTCETPSAGTARRLVR
jgi:hypothetical protein